MKTRIGPALVPSSRLINHAFEAGSSKDHCFCNEHVEGLIEVGLMVYSIWFGEGKGTLLQYSCLENPMDGGAG